jgi:acetyltransferase-like isoleucine patch superfamily enzyme
MVDKKLVDLGVLSYRPVGMFSLRKTRSFTKEKNVQIGRMVKIVGETVIIREGARIDSHCRIEGRTIKLEKNSRLQHHVQIGGLQTDMSQCEIGENAEIFTETFLNDSFPIRIGKNVGIGGRSMIWTHAGWRKFENRFGPVAIEDDAWLAWHVIVNPGITIGAGSIIGGGSVVTKSIPPDSFAAGVPAKVIGRASEYNSHA